ncbi:MAG: hypothetical protein RL215_1640 [Planctomycetota bacterium]|jgi:membrane protein required for colicin V production
MNSSQVVDLLVVGVLVYCAIRGASRGLLSQLAWVVALLLCFKFAGTLSPAVEPFIAVAPPLQQWLAMLAVYVGLCGAAFLAAGAVSGWMEKTKILDFDRHLGGLLGLAKGVVICLTAMYFLITMSPSIRNVVGQTYSGYGAAVILSHSQVLLKLVPEHAVPMVQTVIDRFNQHLRPAVDELAGATPADPNAFPGAGSGSGGRDAWLDGDAAFRLEDLLPDSQRGVGKSGDVRDGDRLDGRRSEPINGDSALAGGADAGEAMMNDILRLLPARVRESLPRATLEAIAESSPAERARLLERLRDAVPAGLGAGQVLSDFLRGSDESRPAVASGPVRLSAADAALLKEIAGIYSQRSDIMERAREHFSGVPSGVVSQVLSDWHADALGLSRDPDSGTDVNTRLDERILRQLNRAGVSLDELDAGLRSRLTQL